MTRDRMRIIKKKGHMKKAMKKHNALKSIILLLGISLVLVFHCALPSKVMAYGAPYDGFVINADGSIFAPGGAGYPSLYYSGNQWWPYPPPAYTGPNSYYPYSGFGYQQSYNPYVPYQILENPYGNNPFLEDDYRPPPNFSNWIWTDPWTAYDPSGGGAVAVNWQPEYIGTSPYFQQTGYNPWNQPYYGYSWNQPYTPVWNSPYNPTWNQPYNYGWNQPYNYGWSPTFSPFNPYSRYAANSTDMFGNLINDEDSEDEEYLVYSALIEEEYDSQNILILNHTFIGHDSQDPDYDNLSSNFEGLEKETVNDYKEKNEQSYYLDDDFSLEDYKLVDKNQQMYNVLKLSRVGLNTERDQAIVYVEKIWANLGGEGYYYFLIKEDGVWIVQDKVMTMIA